MVKEIKDSIDEYIQEEVSIYSRMLEIAEGDIIPLRTYTIGRVEGYIDRLFRESLVSERDCIEYSGKIRHSISDVEKVIKNEKID